MAAKKTTEDEPATTTTTAVANLHATFDQLAELESFETALTWLAEQNVGLVTSDEIEQLVGDGFQYVLKAALVNMPFVILRTDHRMSPSWDVPMVTVYAMTATDRRVKFVDFGAGFREQLSTYERRTGKATTGLLCKNGLSANTYDTTDGLGNTIKATTYRINFGE